MDMGYGEGEELDLQAFKLTPLQQLKLRAFDVGDIQSYI